MKPKKLDGYERRREGIALLSDDLTKAVDVIILAHIETIISIEETDITVSDRVNDIERIMEMRTGITESIRTVRSY